MYVADLGSSFSTPTGLNGFHPIQYMLVTPLNESILWIAALDHLFSTPGCGLVLPNKDSRSQGKTACGFGFSSAEFSAS